MEGFPVAIALVQLRLRHARSLKDKRHVVSGLIQKLKNSGFSCTETAHQDDPKRCDLGVAFVARDSAGIGHAFQELGRHLVGDFEVLGSFREQHDYVPEFTVDAPWYVGVRDDDDSGLD
jgi:uncharacterized protein YlxP (DUF503 family)